jgi:hypothetical protein
MEQTAALTGEPIPLPAYDPSRGDEYEELPPEMEAQIARLAATYVPPAPPPVSEDQQAQAAKDAESEAKIARADRESDAKIARAEREQEAQLRREGVVSDVEGPPDGEPVA